MEGIHPTVENKGKTEKKHKKKSISKLWEILYFVGLMMKG